IINVGLSDTDNSMAKRKRRLKAGIRRFSRQTILIACTVLLTGLIFGYAAALIILKGPSPTFSNLVVSTLMETRRGKRLAHLFFTDDQINEILYKNSIDYTDSVSINNNDEFVIPEDEKDLIIIEDVSGSTFHGKMMMVRDPSRIKLGVNTLLDPELAGEYLVQDYVRATGAVAGINAGGFDDPNGQGDGSIPYGIIIRDGELIYGKPSDWNSVIGFNKENHLIVGNMTAQEALDWGIRDAVTFGPVFIVDGNKITVTGTGGGLNPRTVIGQAADGTVLLLVIDGRQTSSLGASYEDCIKIMQQYGAINAANLDGGSSSVMVYDGEIINSIVTMGEGRSVPTAWLVE
ncbi:MAG: phosphodiester glycosidase family protein, partial [Eubacterium sp.]|nr:phosphodiester glycosidase family protein [Eubacterium sp.]